MRALRAEERKAEDRLIDRYFARKGSVSSRERVAHSPLDGLDTLAARETDPRFQGGKDE